MLHKNGITIDPIKMTIAHRGKVATFQKQNGRSIRFDLICLLIISGPVTHLEMTDAIYGSDADGGPLWAAKAVEVHLNYAKPKLAEVGLRIHRERCGKGDHCYFSKWIAA